MSTKFYVNFKNHEESNTLHITVQDWNVEVVKLFLEHDYSMINWETKDKRTALPKAAVHDKKDVLECLQEQQGSHYKWL